MFKRAQGISMNVIIIAAIALLVLVVLSVIFLGRLGSFSEQTADCQNKGGQCGFGDACGTPDSAVANYDQTYSAWICPDDTGPCCVRAT